MSRWTQRLVGAITMLVLAGLPVIATTCEALCEQTIAPASSGDATEASTHDGMAGCHESAARADQRLTGTPAHDCRTHDGASRETEAAVTSSRVHSVAWLIADSAAFTPSVLVSSPTFSHTSYAAPPDTAPSHAPLVLRI